jgi:hypothetical protein
MSSNDTLRGYQTFVPFVMNSCGVLSGVAEKEPPVAIGPAAPTCGQNQGYEDNESWYNIRSYTDKDGKRQGMFLFLWQNCTTNAMLGSGISGVYNYLGVSIGLHRS